MVTVRLHESSTRPATFKCIPFVFPWLNFLLPCGPTRVLSASFLTFLNHTQRCTAVGRTTLDDWPLVAQTSDNRQISMLLARFAPTISGGQCGSPTVTRSLSDTQVSHISLYQLLVICSKSLGWKYIRGTCYLGQRTVPTTRRTCMKLYCFLYVTQSTNAEC
jgi:hypothetical protein